MSMPKSRSFYTVDQYLKIERGSPERYEYRDGDIFAMAGESAAHADIAVNLVGMLYAQLRGTTCRPRSKDTKVRSGPTLFPGHGTQGMFSYPDVVVVCGDVKYLDEREDVVTNPTAIFEVLSPSTEALDRGEKFTNYQVWNPTLTDYVLVAQDQPRIEHFHREADGKWSYQMHAGLTAAIDLPAIGCKLVLAEVYERVVFAEQEGGIG